MLFFVLLFASFCTLVFPSLPRSYPVLPGVPWHVLGISPVFSGFPGLPWSPPVFPGLPRSSPLFGLPGSSLVFPCIPQSPLVFRLFLVCLGLPQPFCCQNLVLPCLLWSFVFCSVPPQPSLAAWIFVSLKVWMELPHATPQRWVACLTDLSLGVHSGVPTRLVVAYGTWAYGWHMDRNLASSGSDSAWCRNGPFACFQTR